MDRRNRRFDFCFFIALVLGSACSSSRPAEPPPSNDPDTFAALSEDLASAHAKLDFVTDSAPVQSPIARSIPLPTHPSVDAAVRYFAGDRRSTIQASFERSAAYRAMIDAEFRRHGLPPELAFLPVIESGFRPDLTSRAGAHGLWQFMPATAREYGLRVDWWADERTDPVLSTRAAATYLRDLHRMFGDWSLALAAYNCGPGRLRRTMNRVGADSFWELMDAGELPKETRGYVPTFFATAILASSPDDWNFFVPSPSESPTTASVVITGPVSLEFVGREAGIEPAHLRELNLAFRRGIVPPGNHPVRVPDFAAATVASRAGSWHLADPNPGVSTYSLRSGESIPAVAEKLGLNKEEVREMNQSVSGRTVYLPIDRRTLSATLTSAGPAPSQAHVVEPGDTLYSIARANELSVEELREINGLEESHVIRPGDLLIVALIGAISGR